MNPRPKVFVSVIICVAGLSFVTGRLAINARQDPVDKLQGKALPNESRSDHVTAVSAPAQIPDISTLPFEETYRILRAATGETIRSYYNQLAQLPLGPKRNAPMTAFFKTLIQANPSVTKDLILQLKTDDRWLPLQAIRDAATPSGMEAIAEVLLGFDRLDISGCSFDLLKESLDEWGKNDPLALKRFLESHRNQDVERYFDTLVRNWAACDPEAAQQWMGEEIRNHPVPPLVIEDDGSFLVENEGWRSAVERMPEAWVRGLLVNNPDAAVSYVLEHFDDEARESGMFLFGGDLFTISPERARDFVLRLSEKDRSRALQGIGDKANGLVRSDATDNSTSPRYLADWMLQFPPEARQEGIQPVLREWERVNPQELFAWMANLPSQTREAVAQQFPSYVSAENAQGDFDTIMSAGDPILREQLLERLMHGAENARAEMLAVLEQAELSAEQKSHLANLIPPSAMDAAAPPSDATEE